MRLFNDNLIKYGVTVGGSYFTDSHIRLGGWRVDLVNTPGINQAWCDLRYILDKSNGSYGGRYAVYEILNLQLPMYLYIVHPYEYTKGIIKRGEKLFTINTRYYTHFHIRIGNYTSGPYLKILDYFNPKVKFKQNYQGVDVNKYINPGQHIPGSIIINNKKMIELKRVWNFITETSTKLDENGKPIQGAVTNGFLVSVDAVKQLDDKRIIARCIKYGTNQDTLVDANFWLDINNINTKSASIPAFNNFLTLIK